MNDKVRVNRTLSLPVNQTLSSHTRDTDARRTAIYDTRTSLNNHNLSCAITSHPLLAGYH